MATSSRIRRPALQRTKPIRNWATVVSPVPSEHPIDPDVQNANRVVEDYLRAGEAAARLFPGVPGVGNPQDLAQGMVRAASDMMTFWLELMARTTGSRTTTTEGADGARAPAATASQAPAGERLPVSVEVVSSRPTTVTVDLRPEARGATLSLERLHPRGSAAPPLAGARIDALPDWTGVLVRLSVAPRQPAGVYHGVILDDASSRPVGTITVEIRASSPGARRKARR